MTQLDDDKERAELAMIVDVERNDLGSIAEVGSVRIVRPAHVVGHHTVWHRKLGRAGALGVAASGHHRDGSKWKRYGGIKVRAMEVIAQLERSVVVCTRGHGYVTRDGSTARHVDSDDGLQPYPRALLDGRGDRDGFGSRARTRGDPMEGQTARKAHG